MQLTTLLPQHEITWPCSKLPYLEQHPNHLATPPPRVALKNDNERLLYLEQDPGLQAARESSDAAHVVDRAERLDEAAVAGSRLNQGIL